MTPRDDDDVIEQASRRKPYTNDRSPADVLDHLETFRLIELGLSQGYSFDELVAGGVCNQLEADAAALHRDDPAGHARRVEAARRRLLDTDRKLLDSLRTIENRDKH